MNLKLLRFDAKTGALGGPILMASVAHPRWPSTDRLYLGLAIRRQGMAPDVGILPFGRRDLDPSDAPLTVVSIGWRYAEQDVRDGEDVLRSSILCLPKRGAPPDDFCIAVVGLHSVFKVSSADTRATIEPIPLERLGPTDRLLDFKANEIYTFYALGKDPLGIECEGGKWVVWCNDFIDFPAQPRVDSLENYELEKRVQRELTAQPTAEDETVVRPS